MQGINILGKQELHFATSFGFNNVYPELCNAENQNIHGIQYVGLKGLLEWLELRLGIYQKDANDSVRIAVYKKAVKKARDNHTTLYYSDSYESDGWGTAKQLLYWRDELVLSGFNFRCNEPSVNRLYALSKIEECIEDFILGVNDRWQLVYEEVQRVKSIPLSTLHVYEQVNLLPPFFKKLFLALESKQVDVVEKKRSYSIDGDTDLARFKSACLNPTGAALEAKGDGSLLILKAENDLVLAKTLVNYLGSDTNTVLILENDGEVLERALIHNGHPSLGFVRDATDGNLDQLFKAISVFLWNPLNAERLIQFLTLPIAPLPQRLRLKLAEAFTQVVGTNNKKWNEALSKYLDKSERADKDRKQYELWFERDQVSLKMGASKKQVISLYSDLQQWAERYVARLDKPDLKTSFHSLISKCKNFIQVIDIEFEDTDFLKEIEFNNILEEVEVGQIAKPENKELGSFMHVTSSSNITSDCEQVIWWDFTQQPDPFSYRVKFSQAELENLSDCELYSLESELELWYHKLRNPFLHSSKQIILCIPSKINGELAEPNAMLNDIIASFDNYQKLIVDISFNESESVNFAERKILLSKEEHVALPEKIRPEWNVTIDKPVTRRAHESFSSLNALINYPSEYFLNYILGIRPKDIPQTSISNLLRGNIAHRVAEDLFTKDDTLELSTDELSTRIKELITTVVQNEGLTFLIDKNEIALKQFQKLLHNSLVTLTSIIVSNGWEIYKMEEPVKCDTSKIPLSGFIDLQLKRGEELAIVDLKWGGKSHKSKSLIQERDIQLVLYDQMKKSHAKKIHLAYYIINAGQMLARNRDAFSQAFEISSEKTEIEIKDTIWQKLINTYEERWAEFNRGVIEVGDDCYATYLSSMIYSDEKSYLIPELKSKKKVVNPFSKYKSLKGKA